MRVYKFLSKQFAFENLAEHRIKISEYSDMNDPFELWGARLPNTELHSQLTQCISLSGALCFSRNWGNPMLWSHYGDKHKGICLGFDLHVDPAVIQELSYVETPQALDDYALLRAAASVEAPAFRQPEKVFAVPPPAVVAAPAFREAEKVALLLTKFKAWSYEDEVRILLGLREDQRKGALYFADLDEHIRPSVVIVGSRCSATGSEIEAAISGYSMPITVVQAMLSPNSFEVIEDASGLSRE